MLAKLFDKAKAQPQRLHRASPGALIYAIGDIHGRADLLDDLLSFVLEDAQTIEHKRTLLVFLGDYFDRGPDSRGVLDRLIALRERRGLDIVLLKGNHDQAALDFLNDPSTGPNWCDFGGAAALRSYGVEPPRMRTNEAAWARAAEEFRSALPQGHLELLEGLTLWHVEGDYFFAHAGARPGVPLEEQSAKDLLFIRRDFLDDGRAFDRCVVHGHTPEAEVFANDRRIGVDTGAYATGVLSAVRLVGVEKAKLQVARRPGDAVARLGPEPL